MIIKSFSACWVYLLLIFITSCENKQPVDNSQVNQQNTKTRDPFSSFQEPSNKPVTQNPVPPSPQCPGLIAYVTNYRGTRDIHTMNSDGSNSKQLTNSTRFNNQPVWSPDGKYIAYQAFAPSFDSINNQIYVIDVNGNNFKNLSNNEKSSDSLPLWSPNGRYIAFTRGVELPNEIKKSSTNNTSCHQFDNTYDIYMMDADGANQRKLSTLANRDMVMIPIGWSKDSKTIFFHAFKLCNTQTVAYIYALHIDDSKQTLIAEIPQDGRYHTRVTLSPNSKYIAFEARDSDRDMEIYVMNSDGSNLRQLTQNKEVDKYPTWSPDSKFIAFSRAPSDYHLGETLSIIDVTSGLKVADLISNINTVPTLSFEKSRFTWSANGKQIFVKAAGENNKIFTVNVDGSGSKQITSGQDEIVNPRWQPVDCN